MNNIKFNINGGRIEMARRDKMKAALSGMYAQSLKPHTDEGIADQICGKCKNFSENAWASDGRGTCNILKLGSDIGSDPPVFVVDEGDGLLTMTLGDATKCKYFKKMSMMDTDNTECSDPVHRRSIRQMQKD